MLNDLESSLGRTFSALATMKKHSQNSRHHSQPTFTRLSLTLALVALLPTAQNSLAADFYWDNNGATAGFGTAGGTWAAPTTGDATQGWSTDATGATLPSNVTTTTSDSLYFGTETDGLASGTITISGNVEAQNLYFGKSSGNLTLDGGNIIFATNGTTNIEADTSSGTATGTHTINSNLMKDGGVISFGRQNTQGENYIINGIISGTTTLDLRPVNLGAYIALNGLNTFTGNNVGHVTGQVNVNTLKDSGVASSIGTGSIYTMGGGGGQQPVLWYTGTGATSTNRTFRSSSTAAARIIAQDGALDFTGSLATNGGGTYTFELSGTANTGTNTVSGIISDGAGTIRVNLNNFAPIGGSAESGFWVLSGNNTYSGSTSVNGNSILVVGHNNALGSTAGSTTISNGSSLRLDGSAGNLIIAENIFLGSGLGAMRNMSGDNQITGQVTLNDNVDLRRNGGTLTFSGGIVGTNRSIGFNGPFIVDTAAINLGTGGVTWTSSGTDKANASQLNVAGSTWNNTRISFGGYALMGVANALPSATNITFGHDAVVNRNAGALDLNGFDQTVGSIATTPGALNTPLNNQFITDSTGSATLTVNQGAADKEFVGAFTGGVGLTKNGTGELYLRNTSPNATSNSGAFTINEGRIRAGTTTSLSSASAFTVASGAFLELDGNSNSIGSLSGDGTVENGNITAATLTLGGDNSNANFSGTLQDGAGGGALSLVKTGTGTQTLSGTNTYTGTTTVNQGTLQFEKTASLYNGVVASWTATNLIVNSGATAAFNVGGTGEFTSSDIATIQAIGTATEGFQAGSSIGIDTSNAGGSFTYSNVIADTNTGSNSVGVTKLGSGTLVLDGANTYTGTTTIASGTLQANIADGAGTGALGNGGNVTFAGGTLQFTANSAGSDYSSRIVNSTSAIIIDTNGQDVTLASNFVDSNTAGLIKEGAGKLIVEADGTSGATFKGDKVVNGGTLQLFNDDVFNLGYQGRGDFFINNGATLEFAAAGGNRHIPQGNTFTFGSSGGGTIDFTNSVMLFQNRPSASDANTFRTTGGSKNTIKGGTTTMQNSQSLTFDVADGTDTTDLEVQTAFNNGSITKDGAGTLVMTATTNNLGDSNGAAAGGTINTVTINAGTFELGGAGRLQSGNYGGNITNNGIFSHNSSLNQTLNGVISGTGAIEKNSASVLTLTGNSTYSGTTTISNGTILFNGDNSGATGAVTVNSAGSLGGAGTIGGNTSIAGNHFAGSTTTAGAVAQQTFGGNLTYSGGASTVSWELISNSTANPGTNYDQFVIGGDLSFSGTTNLSLSFNGDSGSGSTVDWDDTFWDADQSWVIYDVAGTLTGVPTLVTEGWLDASGDTFSASVGSFALNTSGNDIVLNFTAVPEPSTYGLMGLGLAAFGWAARRRRKKGIQ